MLESLTQLLRPLHEPILFYPFVFLLGLIIGSFLNVVIYRLPKMMESSWFQQCSDFFANQQDYGSHELPNRHPSESLTLWWPLSHCPQCKKSIRPWENIPVFSYLFLRGRCAQCQTKISARYPLVELLTALLSLVLAVHYGWSLQFWASLGLTWLLIALAFIDFDTQLLPDDLTYLGLWAGLLCSLAPVFISPQDAIIGALVGYLSLWSLYWVFKLITGKEGMGYGDFKLMALAGVWVGWQYLPMVLLISSFTGILWGLWRILVKRAHHSHPLPFGPFIALGIWLTLIFKGSWIY